MRSHWNPTQHLTAITALLLAGLLPAADAEWPRFRGPGGDGVSNETGLLKQWPEAGPEVLWRTSLGNGFSGISVAGGRVYTLYGSGSDEFAVCLDAATGKQIWRVRTDDPFTNMHGSGPRSTPTVDGKVVFVLSARGTLHALGAEDGQSIWQRDLQREFGAKVPRWGYSTSPLIEGELLLLDVGGSGESSIVAFDKKNGKEIWRSHSDKAGYSTPIAVTIAGRRQVVFFTGTGVVGLAPDDGALLWTRQWKTSYDVNAATPLFVPPDRIFVSSGYDVGAALYRVKADEQGTGIEQVWRNREMKNKFSSSVLHDGHIYGFDEKMLTCIVAATGEPKWQARGLGHGSLIYADGFLVVLGDKGTLALVEATPGEYREKARAQVFDGKTWTLPSLAGGKLYLRDEHELVALDISG
jgi:outer membrane protein assembly factor BamB